MLEFWNKEWREEPMRIISVWSQLASSWQGIDIDQKQIKRALDVGCGSGWGCSSFFDFGAHGHAVGFDISETALEAAAHRTKGYHTSEYAFALGDAVRLPFRDSSFDLVFSFDMLTLAGKECTKMIEEMWRVTGNYLLFNIGYSDRHRHRTIEGVLRTASLNERKAKKIVSRLAPEQASICAVTYDEFENWGQPIYSQRHSKEGERKMALLILLRKEQSDRDAERAL